MEELNQDAVILSDIHLGLDNCQGDSLQLFLIKLLETPNFSKELIFNGDVFDSWDLRRLQRIHWKVLSLIRKVTKTIKVTWLAGNHDGPVDIISRLLGIEVTEEYVLESGNKKILILHGDKFDDFTIQHPVITNLADWVYRVMQKVDPSFQMAKQAKKSSKTFLRCMDKVRDNAIAYARKKNCEMVCCGHTHFAVADFPYYNSGCWTDKPPHYLSVRDGVVTLYKIDDELTIRCSPQDVS
jgi:UDP-2,3-diacylglucosamine pyrophosphatase LpxH